MRESTIRLVVAVAVASGAAACGRGGPPVAAAVPDECAIVASDSTAADSIVVLLEHTVDPRHAPVPSNRSERLVFNHAYESLVRIDCAGNEYPTVAEAWRKEARGSQWWFDLRGDARFADGSPVTALDVVRAWLERAPRDTTQPPWDLIRPESVTVIDDRAFRVALTRSVDSPRAFAHPLFSVVKTSRGYRWPLGTGPYQIVDVSDGGGREVVAAPVDLGSRLPVVRFRAADGADARDHLDRDVDLLVTEDVRAIGYASSRTGFVTRPLPWDRTYVLTGPGLTVLDGGPEQGVPSWVRSALARDAVRAPSRGASAPYWWLGAGSCRWQRKAVPVDRRPLGNRIVYDRSDPVARDIAERMVALLDGALVDGRRFDARGLFGSAADRGERYVAVGLDPARFVRRLAAGDERAFVSAIPRRALDPCAAVATLLTQMPWLTADAPSRVGNHELITVDRLGLEMLIVPLVDTRPHLIMRGERVGPLYLGWDGAVRPRGPFR